MSRIPIIGLGLNNHLKQSMSAIWPRILCVNNYPDMLTYLEICCRRLGEFNSESSGEKALAFLESEQVDIVITDVSLGKMNGYELCQAIRSDERWKDIPIILTSSMQKNEFQKRGLSAGASLILGMPFMPKLVRQHIRNLTSKGITSRYR